MSQPQRWQLGLIPLLFLGLLAGWYETPRIEQALSQGASAALSAAGSDLRASEVHAQGRDVAIRGEALRSGVADKALADIRQLPAARLVEASFTAAAVRSPYLLTFAKDGKSLTLGGYYPDGAARAAVVEKTRAAFSGYEIADRMEPAAGAPPLYAQAADLALSHLGRMTRGRASLAGSSYSLEGVAASSDDYRSLLESFAALPAGFGRGAFGVVPPPAGDYVFSAQSKNGRLHVAGLVPDARVRDEILALARASSPVEDALGFASGAPEGFAQAVRQGLSLLARMSEGEFRLVGKSFHLSGVARDLDSLKALSASVQSLPQGVERGAVAIAPPVMSPFLWMLRRERDGAIMEGGVASEALRARLLAEARRLFAAGKIEDRMQLASGEPDQFEAAALLAMAQAAQLNGGAAALASDVWSIRGEAVDAALAERVASALKGLPKGFRLGAADISVAIPQVNPFVWGVRRLSDGSLAMEGAVPGEAARQALLALARRLYPGAAITDAMYVARTAPEGFERAAALAVEAVGGLARGTIRLSDRSITATGEAASAEQAGKLAQAFAALGSGYGFDASGVSAPALAATAPVVQPTEPAPRDAPAGEPTPHGERSSASHAQPGVSRPSSCADGQRLWQATFFFEEGAFALPPGAEERLRGALDALSSCSGARVRIEGHTNSHGDRRSNIALSSLRSFAVSRWLQSRGVPLRRIETLGFGEDRPLASESSDEGAAQNRRVEISIQIPLR